MQTRGKKRERNGEREDKKRRHLSFLLLAHRAFVAHAVRLACGCSFPFSGKRKGMFLLQTSPYFFGQL